jgi:glycosyltransferase involved in cell wall biosynthesis
MRVVQLYFPGPFGGAEQVILFGSNALRQQKLKSPIIAVQDMRVPHYAEQFLRKAKSLDLETIMPVSKGRLDLVLCFKLRALLRDLHPEIIHAHCHKAAFYGYLCRSKEAKLVFTSHGYFPDPSLKGKFYDAVEMYVMRRSDRVIAVSEALKQELVREAVPPDAIAVIENFFPLSVKKRRLPENGKMKLLFVGRLTRRKGCHDLLLALSRLKDRIGLELTVVGDGNERDALIRMVSRLDLESVVRFAGFQEDVAPYMAEYDALVFPSLKEGYPLVLIEACCLGLPILASDIDPSPQIVRSGVNGILFAPGDAEAIAKAILSMNANRFDFLYRAKQMASGYIERFSHKKWAADIIGIYDDVLGRA